MRCPNVQGDLHDEVGELRPELKALLDDIHVKLTAKPYIPDESTAAARNATGSPNQDDNVKGTSESNQNESTTASSKDPDDSTATDQGDNNDDGSAEHEETQSTTASPGPAASKDPDDFSATNQGSHGKKSAGTGRAAPARAPHKAYSNDTFDFSTATNRDAISGSNITRRHDSDRYSPGRQGSIRGPGFDYKHVLKVGEKLTGILMAPDFMSAVSPSRTHGSIIFAKLILEPSAASGAEENADPLSESQKENHAKSSAESGKDELVTPYGDSGKRKRRSLNPRTTVLVDSNPGKVHWVLNAREEVMKERQEEKQRLEAQEQGLEKEEDEVVEGALAKRMKAWGWVFRPIGHDKQMERTREHLGEVEMTIDNRGCVVSTLRCHS